MTRLNKHTVRTALAALTTLTTLAMGVGCSDSDPSSDTRTLTQSFAGLDVLGADFVYEGWIIVDGAPVSTGRFNVDADGNPTTAAPTMPAAMVDSATTFILTIEPAVGDDPAPSAVHVLAGDLSGGVASLTVAHGAALATDFASAEGQFILETPSSAAPEDYNQGIWWLVPGDAPSAGLTLPALADGWAYEGWVVGSDGPVSTGTFTVAAGADSDLAGATGGPDGDGPPFPGQDFITPAVSLLGQTAVISVEPVPDTSAAPFALKPLVLMDIQDVMAPTTQFMSNNAAATNPTGVAMFE